MTTTMNDFTFLDFENRNPFRKDPADQFLQKLRGNELDSNSVFTDYLDPKVCETVMAFAVLAVKNIFYKPDQFTFHQLPTISLFWHCFLAKN